MSLNVRFDINGEVIGQLVITRREDNGDQAHYQYHYSGAHGSSTGFIWHRPDDGAMVLAAKIIEQIDFPNWRLV